LVFKSPTQPLFVFQSVCGITQKPHGETSPNSLCALPMAMAQFSSDGVVIGYARPFFADDSFLSLGTVG